MARQVQRQCNSCLAVFTAGSAAGKFCSVCKKAEVTVFCACGCGSAKQVKRHRSTNSHFLLGHGAKGRRHTEAAKAAIAASKLGKARSAETVAKIANKRRGVSPTEEARLNVSRALRAPGEQHPAKRIEVRQKIAAAHKGKTVSQETRRKISLARGRAAQKPTKPELMLLAALGDDYKYAGQNQFDAGQPISADIVHVSKRIIVQVDGCYWHNCPQCNIKNAPNTSGRDERLTKQAEARGWQVLRFWEHQIIESLADVVSTVKDLTNG